MWYTIPHLWVKVTTYVVYYTTYVVYYTTNVNSPEIPILLKMEVFSKLTPSPGLSGMSLSSYSPGRELNDRWSFDIVSNVRSR